MNAPISSDQPARGTAVAEPFRLDGKVAIVTGSSRGIGHAIAASMARAGAHVIVSSRKADACEATAEELRREGLSAAAIPCHVGRDDALRELVDGCVARFGRLDICVANAAANPALGTLESLSLEAWDKVMQVNLRSVFVLAQLARPHLARNGDGSLIAVSSIGALRTERGIAAYNISKLALLGLVQNLASEWGPSGVRVNAIAPGLVRTDFARAIWENPKVAEATIAHTPLRRIGEPDDIGNIAVFLAARASRFVTGQTIVADGGMTNVGAMSG